MKPLQDKALGSLVQLALLSVGLPILCSGCFPLGGINHPRVLKANTFQAEAYLAPGVATERYMAYKGRVITNDVEQLTDYQEEESTNWLLQVGMGVRYSPWDGIEVGAKVFGPWPGAEFGVRAEAAAIGQQFLTVGLNGGSNLPLTAVGEKDPIYSGYSYLSPSLVFGSERGYLVSKWFIPNTEEVFRYTGFGLGRQFTEYFSAELLVYRNLNSQKDRYREVSWMVVPSLAFYTSWN